MASAEQNALLAIQLGQLAFQPIAEDRARANALMQLQRDQDFKRELANQGDERAFELARYAGDREDRRQTGAETRAVNRDNAMLKLQTAREEASELKQDKTIAAAEKRALEAKFSEKYPEYALWAARAGMEVKQRDEYKTTPDGFGQLGADLAAARDGAEKAQRKAAAVPIEGNISRLMKQAQEFRTAADATRTPTDADKKQALSLAAGELAKRIENGQQYAGLPKDKKTINNAIALLRRGDSTEAATLLGAAAFADFETLQGALLNSLLSAPDRRAAAAQAEQAWRGAQSNLDRFMQQVGEAAAKNEFVAEAFTRGSASLEQMMRPAPKESDEDKARRVTPAPGAPAPTPTPVVSPETSSGGGFGFGGVPIPRSGPAPTPTSQGPNWFGFGGVPAGPAAVQPIIPTALPPDLMESLRKVKTPRLDPEVRRQEIQSQMDSLVQQYGRDAYFTPEHMRLSAELMRSGR